MDSKAWREESPLSWKTGTGKNTLIFQQVVAILEDDPMKGLSSRALWSNSPWSVGLLLGAGP